jgi:ATP-dependent DNA helicase RecQ
LEQSECLRLQQPQPPSVVEDICKSFDIEKRDSIVTGFYRPNLTFVTTPTSSDERDRLLAYQLKDRLPGPTIVYVTLQKTAELVAELLAKQNLPARAYHAGLESDLRSEVQEWWMREPNGIVVATIAFGMGIDKSNVRYVYHYNLPKSLESYSQEIGRAGRDGKASIVELLACSDDIPTLENFAYGDTPASESIRGLVCEALSWSFDTPIGISPFELSQRFDMRLLVLRTALTYLELMGLVRSGTPIYAGYELRPLRSIQSISGEFPGEHGEFVLSLFKFAKHGRIWYVLNPDDAAKFLGVERRRVIRAIEVMEERGMIEVKAGDVRTPYTRVEADFDAAQITSELIRRFERRKQQEIIRLKKVVDLIEHDGCQVNALVGYFGEQRNKPCGHCTYCLLKKRQRLPIPASTVIPVSSSEALELSRRCPKELQSPRHLAKLLCGLSSPAFTKHKLMRDKLFGSTENCRFEDVVSWCTQLLPK